MYSGPREASWFEVEDAYMHVVLIVGFREIRKGKKTTKYLIIQNLHDLIGAMMDSGRLIGQCATEGSSSMLHGTLKV